MITSKTKTTVGVLVTAMTVFAVALFLGPTQASAADWSTTELHVQVGELDNPNFQQAERGKKSDTVIYTWQHASGWKYGDNFFFIDHIDAEGAPFEIYSEWYSSFSLSKITGEEFGFWRVRDIGLHVGVNWDADADVIKVLPGIRLAWDIPGFVFANTDWDAYIDANGGTGAGGAPKEDDSWIVDFNWATKQWEIAGTKWNLEGHIEFIDNRDNEFGGEVADWILAQPQLRMDLTDLIHKLTGFELGSQIFVGIEYQWWDNKLGDRGTDESEAQGLLVWRL